jgi:hypothetical protein
MRQRLGLSRLGRITSLAVCFFVVDGGLGFRMHIVRVCIHKDTQSSGLRKKQVPDAPVTQAVRQSAKL